MHNVLKCISKIEFFQFNSIQIFVICKMRQIEVGKTKPIPPLLRIADSAGAAIMGPLAVLQALTPEIPVVSEEDVDSHALCLSLRSYWIMDPLDGPKEFLACNGEFTVNVALIEDCEPTIGVVLAPALGAVFWGVRGQGLFAAATRVSSPSMWRLFRWRMVFPGESWRAEAI